MEKRRHAVYRAEQEGEGLSGPSPGGREEAQLRELTAWLLLEAGGKKIKTILLIMEPLL